jgi:hypothetical protein
MLALLLTSALAVVNARATVVTTIAGGPTSASDSTKGAGYVDGETAVASRFNQPMGMAFDSAGYLYVADYNNNAIRVLDLVNDETTTFVTANHPVGITIDQSDNIYVLNYGNGTNGTLVQYDVFGDLIATNATGIKFAGGVTSDFKYDVYVTSSNQVIQVLGSQGTALLATLPPGSLLKGITVMESGLLAVADYGRNGIYNLDPSQGAVLATNGLGQTIITGIVTTNSGFNGAGDTFGGTTRAKFFQPFGLLSVGNDSLIVSDAGNNRVKVVNNLGVVTNLYGVDSNYWEPFPTPGLWDGTVVYGSPAFNYDASNNVEARLPMGIAMNQGTLYVTEDYYHVIRTVTAASLPVPPQAPAQVGAPLIGYATFSINSLGYVVANFNPLSGTSVGVFNNDQVFVVYNTNQNVQTYLTYAPTPTVGTIPDPTTNSPTVSYPFTNGISYSSLGQLPGGIYGNMVPVSGQTTIKAISASLGAPISDVAVANVAYIVGNPTVSGGNAAQFTVSSTTTNATIYYTIDGTNPTNGISSRATNGQTLSLPPTGSNIVFKAIASRPGYLDSAVVTTTFTANNYSPNVISFGFASGEASSEFIGLPGQYFYAPVTLTVLPNQTIYSMVFNVTVTNNTPASPPIVPYTYEFSSFLEKPAPPPAPANTFVQIEPYTFVDATTPPDNNAVFYDGAWYQNLVTADTTGGQNLLSVGWIERYSRTNLYNTLGQTLISYSQAHDVQYLSSAGQVEVGAYGFQIPRNAVVSNSYAIQINRPSASADGIGTPGSAIYLSAPTNGAIGAGAPINALKIVTVGRGIDASYIAGSVYPFRWFNGGDFGSTNIIDSDLEQVYQSAIAGPIAYNTPPTNTDFYDGMDSCGSLGVLDGNMLDEVTYNGSTNYIYTNSYSYLDANQRESLLSLNDQSLANQIAFGDGVLDVCDVYLSYLRAVDGNYVLYRRFWNNGQRVAIQAPNLAGRSNLASRPVNTKPVTHTSAGPASTINFTAGDYVGSAGQTVQVPITASVFGNYPARAVMLNVTVDPLDGSPDLTASPGFIQTAAALGRPAPFSQGAFANSYSLAWLNVTNAGITGSTVIGMLSFTIPANATANSAYAVHFDHASASPNGFISFPKSVYSGLVTLSSRTNSSYGDGIPDSWRLRWFGTLNNYLSASNADACGDGFNNWQKYIAGTDPTDASAYPRLLPKSSVPVGSTSAIHWPTVSGKQYAIERSVSLYGGWTPVSTNTGTGTDMEFDDNVAGGARFYRVRILP